ncbi:metallopeptidase TldD-related protein [Spongisporangium articulatum]|uniref:Metallopeptidase TldD-related protein n=1 Tax=Spongisporangium articulatum TaxID=3362603 RepID=A0ABW8ARK6_9ACTN
MSDDPQVLVEAGLEAARSLAGGPFGAVVIVEESWQVNLRWALSGLTTNGFTRSRTVTAVVTTPVEGGTAAGVLTRPATDVTAVRALVADAAGVARTGAPAEDAAELVSGDVLPGWDDPAEETGPATLADVAGALGELFARDRATPGRESFGFARHELSTSWLGTSGGLRYRVVEPVGMIELNGKSENRSRSAWAGRGTRDFTDVDVPALDAEISQGLAWQANRIALPPGRYDTVLPPSAVADLMVYAYWSADARSAAEGRSVYSAPGGPPGRTRLGEPLTDVPLSLRSDPADPALGCADRVIARASSPTASVFDNGLPTPAVHWLDGGRLTALAGTRHTEALTGVPRAGAVGNLSLSAPEGTGTAVDLAAGLGDGLLLTCLWYIREVDPQTLLLTGLTRDGVYVVRGGEVVGATSNFRFNESPVDALSRVAAVGAPELCLPREWSDWFTRARMPALLVRGMNMSSVSEAS